MKTRYNILAELKSKSSKSVKWKYERNTTHDMNNQLGANCLVYFNYETEHSRLCLDMHSYLHHIAPCFFKALT